MTNIYQLVLSVDQSFQDKIDIIYARLATVAGRERADGRIAPVRSSKKRIVHAGVIALDYLSKNEIVFLSKKVRILNKADAPRVLAKHTAVEIHKRFARMANAKASNLALYFNFDHSPRDLMHYGIVSLAEQTDDAFEFLVHASINIEEGQPLRQGAFYDSPQTSLP